MDIRLKPIETAKQTFGRYGVEPNSYEFIKAKVFAAFRTLDPGAFDLILRQQFVRQICTLFLMKCSASGPSTSSWTRRLVIENLRSSSSRPLPSSSGIRKRQRLRQTRGGELRRSSPCLTMRLSACYASDLAFSVASLIGRAWVSPTGSGLPTTKTTVAVPMSRIGCLSGLVYGLSRSSDLGRVLIDDIGPIRMTEPFIELLATYRCRYWPEVH